MTLLCIVVAALLAILAAANLFGAVRVATVLFIATTLLYPRVLLSSRSVWHVGIASAGPDLSTYGLGTGMAFLLLRITKVGTRSRLHWYVPLALFTFMASLSVWPGSTEQWAGIEQLAVGIGGWAVGSVIGSQMGNVRHRRVFLWCIAAVGAVQCLLSLLQYLGLASAAIDIRTAELTAGRASGTFNHPNNLGKALFFVLCLALPFSGLARIRERALAFVAIVASLTALVLTGGRAATLAGVAVTAIWAVCRPKAQAQSGALARSIVPILLATGAAIGFLDLFIARVQADPSGGFRARLLEAALAALPHHAWAGVGPNLYVPTVGASDPLTAQGWPVHNTFVLAAVELGIIGAVMLLAPIVVAIGSSFPHMRRNGASRALVAALPGFLVIGFTGWGLLANSLFPLWLFTVAFLLSLRHTEMELDQDTSHIVSDVKVGAEKAAGVG